MCAAASNVLARPAHQLCGRELHISLVTGLGDSQDALNMDEVLGSDGDTLSCAIEVCDLAPGINDELLKMFFENRKRSGGDKIADDDLYYQDKERRAVITFSNPEGCIALCLSDIIRSLLYILQDDRYGIKD